MRYGRVRAAEGAEAGYYHCISRIVGREFLLDELEKERLVKLMRSYEEFCGVCVITFCIMSNHFHLLVKLPRRPAPENLPPDEELVRLAAIAKCTYGGMDLAADLKRLREAGDEAGANALREKIFRRMWNISEFLRILKQRFTQDYNTRHHRTGTLWEGRFKSVLVEGSCGGEAAAGGAALPAMAAYIDLNPVRAGLVSAPEDYRWCGYAEAAAGSAAARKGLGIAMRVRFVQPLADAEVLPEYRRFLFEEGAERAAEEDGTGARKGFSEAEVEAVIQAGGKLPFHKAMRCRVRYFTDGVVFGGKAFVEDFFRSNRTRFGATRRDGARPLNGIDLPGLYTVRALRVGVIKVPEAALPV